MRILIPVDVEKNDFEVAECFGRAARYLTLDTESDDLEWTIPDSRIDGCRSARLFHRLGIDAVACRHIGDKGTEILRRKRIPIFRLPIQQLGMAIALVSSGSLRTCDATGCVAGGPCGAHADCECDQQTRDC